MLNGNYHYFNGNKNLLQPFCVNSSNLYPFSNNKLNNNSYNYNNYYINASNNSCTSNFISLSSKNLHPLSQNPNFSMNINQNNNNNLMFHPNSTQFINPTNMTYLSQAYHMKDNFPCTLSNLSTFNNSVKSFDVDNRYKFNKSSPDKRVKSRFIHN